MNKYSKLAHAAPSEPEDDFFELQDAEVTLEGLEFPEQIQKPEQTGWFSRGAFMNMTNSILGAGVIGQPFAFKNCGFLGGILVTLVVTVLIDWTLRLIVWNAQKSKTKSYQDTVGYCFGKWGRYLLLFSISSFAYGGLAAFCVIIGDTIPHVLVLILPTSITKSHLAGWIFQRNSIITLFTLCISYPLSLNRDISKLAKTSGLALVSMVIIVLLTIVRGAFLETPPRVPLSDVPWIFNKNIFQGVSVVSFALVCHHNAMFIFESLRNPEYAHFARLTHITCGVSMFFCLTMGSVGLVYFGQNTKGNILNNFKSNDLWMNIARFCFGFNMLTTFPLELFVVRDVIKDFVVMNEADESGNTAHLELSTKQHFIATTILTFSAMGLSLLTCNLGMILELVGATSASLMAYIIPPMCYLKLLLDESDFRKAPRKERIHFVLYKAGPAILCTIFGLLIMVFSSLSTIKNSINNPGDVSHCQSD